MRRLNSRLYCIVLLAVLCFVPRAIFADDVLFQDDFSSGNFSNWKVTQNFLWGNPSNTCRNGDGPAFWEVFLQQLGITIDGPGCYTEIVPNNFQLPDDTGYAFSFDMSFPSSVNEDRNYAIRTVDANNNYGVHILNNTIHLDKVVQGMVWTLPNSEALFNFQPDQTYHIRNEIDSEHAIRIFVNDTLVLSTRDSSPYLSGGTIGFRASVGAISKSEVWFDNAVVTRLSLAGDINLDVPYYSQRDPQWSAELYDSAPNWAKADVTTIDRWGCALSSAVMMLRFHGISQIADGIDLNPSTLNTWLQQQPDGYVGDGLVNWIALMRLVHTFHQSHPTVPELEYTYADFSLDTIQSQLHSQNPSIIELPKHFVLAKGFATSSNQTLIHDPYVEDHRALDPDVSHPISLRVFTPSFTDLSYILVVHDPGIELHLLDGETEAQTFEESLDDDVEPDDFHTSVLHQIAKPHDGIYNITIRAEDPQPFQTTLYFYHADGEVQQKTLSGIASATPIAYQITYSSSGNSTIQRMTQHAFLETLNTAYHNHEIDSAFAYYSLKKIAEFMDASTADAEAQARYTALLETMLEKFKSEISTDARATLAQTLSAEQN